MMWNFPFLNEERLKRTPESSKPQGSNKILAFFEYQLPKGSLLLIFIKKNRGSGAVQKFIWECMEV